MRNGESKLTPPVSDCAVLADDVFRHIGQIVIDEIGLISIVMQVFDVIS